MSIDRLPNLTFFGVGVSWPGVTLSPATMPTPRIELPFPGDHMSYTELGIKFRVNEDWESYLEIYDWLTQLATPVDSEQYGDLAINDPLGEVNPYARATVTLMSQASRPLVTGTFENLFPSYLGELQLSVEADDVVYLEATAQFRFHYLTIRKLQ